jgi:hypothetical protein
MHPAVLSNIFLSKPILFMPDVFLKYDISNLKSQRSNMKYKNMKHEKKNRDELM